jgi:hypothetical protein
MREQADRARLFEALSRCYDLLSSFPGLENSVAKEVDALLRTLRMEEDETESESARERKRIEGMMRDFEPERSPAKIALTARYGRELTLVRLVAMAKSLVEQFKGAVTPLERIHKRRKSVLMQWFDRNWETIEPVVMGANIGMPHEMSECDGYAEELFLIEN